MDEMTFLILSQAGADEPFHMLVSGIASHLPPVLEEFLRALAGLVDDGLLTYRITAKEKKDWSAKGGISGLYGELVAYVEQRVRFTERLHEERDEDAADYLFSITLAGSEKVDELYADAAARGMGIINAIRDFKQRRGSLPSNLSELLPDYPEVGIAPFDGCGSWWYRPAENQLAFRFGYITMCGHHQFYDELRDDWSPHLPPVTM
jgi:hypothetical protein